MLTGLSLQRPALVAPAIAWPACGEIHVPDEFDTIQEAIDAADGGETVKTGGGLKIQFASPIVRDCIITGDNASVFGGGIQTGLFCKNCVLTLIQICASFQAWAT